MHSKKKKKKKKKEKTVVLKSFDFQTTAFKIAQTPDQTSSASEPENYHNPMPSTRPEPRKSVPPAPCLSYKGPSCCLQPSSVNR